MESCGVHRRQSKTGLGGIRPGLDELHALFELGPVGHNDFDTELSEALAHLLPHILVVATDVADDGHTSTDGRESTGLAVLNRDSLGGGLVAVFQSMKVDRWVGLGSGLLQRGSGTEDLVMIEVLVLADLLDGSAHATESGRGDHSQTVLLRGKELLQFVTGTNTGLGLSFQLGNDLVLLFRDVGLQLILLHLELVLGLKRDHHTAEVLADKILDQLATGVSVGNAALLQDFICEVCASLEGQLF